MLHSPTCFRWVAATERTHWAKWMLVLRRLMSVGIICRIKITILSIETTLKLVVIWLWFVSRPYTGRSSKKPVVIWLSLRPQVVLFSLRQEPALSMAEWVEWIRGVKIGKNSPSFQSKTLIPQNKNQKFFKILTYCPKSSYERRATGNGYIFATKVHVALIIEAYLFFASGQKKPNYKLVLECRSQGYRLVVSQ